jgi:hypothetical protein
MLGGKLKPPLPNRLVVALVSWGRSGRSRPGWLRRAGEELWKLAHHGHFAPRWGWHACGEA